jgi:hypothetical protein
MATCWAFDKQMRRCSLSAGHRGNHQLTVTWADDECFNPLVMSIPHEQAEPQEINPMLEYDTTPPKPAPVVESCIACTHKHIGGSCKCGCYEHI